MFAMHITTLLTTTAAEIGDRLKAHKPEVVHVPWTHKYAFSPRWHVGSLQFDHAADAHAEAAQTAAFEAFGLVTYARTMPAVLGEVQALLSAASY